MIKKKEGEGKKNERIPFVEQLIRERLSQFIVVEGVATTTTLVEITLTYIRAYVT